MHVVRGLDRDAAGVEGDPLPHEGDVVLRSTAAVAVPSAPAVIAHDDEARLLVTPLRELHSREASASSCSPARWRDAAADSPRHPRPLRGRSPSPLASA